MKAKKSSLLLSRWTQQLFGAKMNYRLRYMHQRGHWPNLKHPQDMSEILISKLFTPPICQQLSQYVDKVRVRDFIRQQGLEDILLKHYGVWNRPEDIDFDALPQQFILKANNGCGNHYICRDKSLLNREEAVATLKKSIESGRNHVEPHYHYIEPKVFCEELIDTGSTALPTDYKFTCINGEIMDTFVATERETNAKYCTLDLNWNLLPYTKKEYLPKHLPEPPKHLDRLIEVAQQLSRGFDFVRVDLYEYRDKPYFSELTFFPWGALLYSYTDEAIKLYGEKARKKG